MIVISGYGAAYASIAPARDQGRPVKFYRYRANDESPSFQKPVTMERVADNSADEG